MKRIILFIPLILLTVICFFFFLFILYEKDPNDPPSALINKELPVFTTTSLYNADELLYSEALKKQYTLINFFASWCAPCKTEHPLFFELKKHQPELFILGIAHKDEPKNSKKFLNEEGDPYSFVGLDQDGKIALEFGVFGLPETFIINSEGKIIFKHTGPLTKKIIKNEITSLF